MLVFKAADETGQTVSLCALGYLTNVNDLTGTMEQNI